MRKLLVTAFLVVWATIAAVAAQPVARLQLPCESPYQVLSPAGTQVAVQCKDHSLHLVAIRSGREDKVFPGEQPANTFVYSPDGRWLALGYADGRVEITPSGNAGAAKTFKTGSRRVDMLYFFPDGKMLFVAPVDSPGQVWALGESPVQVATWPVDFGGVTAAAVTPDGKLLVTAGDDTVVRWYDTASWQKTREFREFLLEPFALAFTEDGKQVLAGGADSRVTVFDASTAKQIAQLPPEAGWYISEIRMLDHDRALTVYFDNAGEKPPQALIWSLASAKSEAVKTVVPPTCGGPVAGKLWLCTVEGKTLNIWQQE